MSSDPVAAVVEQESDSATSSALFSPDASRTPSNASNSDNDNDNDDDDDNEEHAPAQHQQDVSTASRPGAAASSSSSGVALVRPTLFPDAPLVPPAIANESKTGLSRWLVLKVLFDRGTPTTIGDLSAGCRSSWSRGACSVKNVMSHLYSVANKNVVTLNRGSGPIGETVVTLNVDAALRSDEGAELRHFLPANDPRRSSNYSNNNGNINHQNHRPSAVESRPAGAAGAAAAAQRPRAAYGDGARDLSKVHAIVFNVLNKALNSGYGHCVNQNKFFSSFRSNRRPTLSEVIDGLVRAGELELLDGGSSFRMSASATGRGDGGVAATAGAQPESGRRRERSPDDDDEQQRRRDHPLRRQDQQQGHHPHEQAPLPPRYVLDGMVHCGAHVGRSPISFPPPIRVWRGQATIDSPPHPACLSVPPPLMRRL